jgi:hypothetical protein
MPFNFCPLDARAQTIFKVFSALPAHQRKPRIPIAERAAGSGLCLMMSQGQARHMVRARTGMFEFEKNLIYFENNSQITDTNMMAAAMRNFAPIFNNAHVYVWVDDRTHYSPSFTISAYDRDVFRHGMPKHTGNDKPYMARIEFGVDDKDKHMFLARLDSPVSCFGGKMLVGLYNFASAIGTSSIDFTANTRIAKLFYFHMDFGAPREADPTWWELKL